MDMNKLKTKQAAHRVFAEQQRQKKRERRANRAMLEAKGIDTSPRPVVVQETLAAVKTPDEAALKRLNKTDLALHAQNAGMQVKSKTTKQQMLDHLMGRS